MTVSLTLSFRRRMLSFTIRSRLTPPMACSIRILMEEIRRFVAFSGGVSSPPGGVFLGWIMVTTAARRQRLPRQFCQALIRGLAFIRVTQEAHATSLVDHEEVFERVTLLLAAVIFLWLFRIGRAVARTFSAILPKRGVGALSSVACVLNSAANSAAVRAGSRSWSA